MPTFTPKLIRFFSFTQETQAINGENNGECSIKLMNTKLNVRAPNRERKSDKQTISICPATTEAAAL